MRSTNMQAQTDQLKGRHPGIVIYGIGDEAHKDSPSGHNEDDTAGSKPEREDSDSNPEHRAIDVMIGPAFTAAEAEDLTQKLIRRPANQRRLIYVIYNRRIWQKKNGWVEEHYGKSDPHTNHVHESGDPLDDENGADWDIDDAPAPAGEPADDTTEDGTMVITYIFAKAKDGKPLRWGLGLVSAGELFWFETTDQGRANGYGAGVERNALEVSQAAFDAERAVFAEAGA